MRVKSLKDLGKGAWKLNSETAVPASIKSSKPDNNVIQNILWTEVRLLWPELAVSEYTNAVPGRRFRIDIAIPSVKLGIEVDGWQFHGKYKADFTKDRVRQNLLVINGWRILRFTANQIRTELAMCLDQIETAIKAK